MQAIYYKNIPTNNKQYTNMLTEIFEQLESIN